MTPPDFVSVPTFESLWAEKEKQGYRYGHDAIKQVRFGYEILKAAIADKKEA